MDSDQNTGHTPQLNTDTDPETESTFSLKDRPLKSVTIRRAVLKEELIEIFRGPSIMDCDLDFTVIDNSGKEEEGKGSGVIREILTCFWDQCYNSLMVGALKKVPSVRHDFQKLEWESIGRILVYGFN